MLFFLFSVRLNFFNYKLCFIDFDETGKVTEKKTTNRRQ